jgi:hypothetical protein
MPANLRCLSATNRFREVRLASSVRPIFSSGLLFRNVDWRAQSGCFWWLVFYNQAQWWSEANSRRECFWWGQCRINITPGGSLDEGCFLPYQGWISTLTWPAKLTLSYCSRHYRLSVLVVTWKVARTLWKSRHHLSRHPALLKVKV